MNEPHGELHDQLLTGWGRTAATRATVWTPSRAEDVGARLSDFRGRGVIARGLGRSYGDAAQNAGGTVVLATALDRVIELDVQKGLLTTEAGVSLDALLRILVPLGWFPKVVPGTRYVTVGGAIASDIHGKSRQGSFSDHIERIRLATPARGVLTTGPETESDVFWATAGGMGLTGIVTEATMRLRPIETSRLAVDIERASDVDDCMERMLDSDENYQYSVAWIDCVAGGKRLGRSVLTRGNHATLDQLPQKMLPSARAYNPRTMLVAPPYIPSGVLNAMSVRAFNELWFHIHPKEKRNDIETIPQFFHPLDFASGWNRIYGPRGFVQYQYVVPYGAEHVVRRTLERLSSARCASFLAVLKRFESENAGMLSFPTPGWTLALDIPADRAGLVELLDGLDELVLEAGGRIYFTKDSRVRAAHVPTMYPGLDRWREVQAGLDPDQRMCSDMNRRLHLTAQRPG